MKKKAQKFSFIMMIVFALTGIAMTIVSAVTVGSTGSYGYGSSSPLAGLVFPIILGGLVGTFSVTAIWACVLEHFSNAACACKQVGNDSTINGTEGFGYSIANKIKYSCF